jgi:AcrR family transcriptional regulator
MKQKREKGKRTTERIIESAAVLFAEKSFSGVTVRMIAGKAGIRESSIYNHFKSKDGILNTLYSRYLDVRKGV